MKVRFWGVRGSLPTPGRKTVRYGGNTSCVEVRLGERRVILDAGSGLVEFVAATAADPGPVNIDLLLSHTHYDHICGLPFYAPLFQPKNEVRIWSGRLNPRHLRRGGAAIEHDPTADARHGGADSGAGRIS